MNVAAIMEPLVLLPFVGSLLFQTTNTITIPMPVFRFQTQVNVAVIAMSECNNNNASGEQGSVQAALKAWPVLSRYDTAHR